MLLEDSNEKLTSYYNIKWKVLIYLHESQKNPPYSKEEAIPILSRTRWIIIQLHLCTDQHMVQKYNSTCWNFPSYQ